MQIIPQWHEIFLSTLTDSELSEFFSDFLHELNEMTHPNDDGFVGCESEINLSRSQLSFVRLGVIQMFRQAENPLFECHVFCKRLRASLLNK